MIFGKVFVINAFTLAKEGKEKTCFFFIPNTYQMRNNMSDQQSKTGSVCNNYYCRFVLLTGTN